jgi:ferritin-like metal-binding protein YciE
VPELKIKRMKCLAMEGLVEEGQEIIDSVEKGPVRDAGLIAAAQKAEHYEIATYGTLCALADKLGYTKAKNLLAETLQEEKNTDDKLTMIAEKKINQKAA